MSPSPPSYWYIVLLKVFLLCLFDDHTSGLHVARLGRGSSRFSILPPLCFRSLPCRPGVGTTCGVASVRPLTSHPWAHTPNRWPFVTHEGCTREHTLPSPREIEQAGAPWGRIGSPLLTRCMQFYCLGPCRAPAPLWHRVPRPRLRAENVFGAQRPHSLKEHPEASISYQEPLVSLDMARVHSPRAQQMRRSPHPVVLYGLVDATK